MIDYKENIINWLNKYYVNKDLSNTYIIDDIDDIIQINGYRNFDKLIMINDGILLLKSLIDIIKENNILNEFIPTLIINLKDVEKYIFNIFKDIYEVKDCMSYTPPTIALFKKIEETESRDFEYFKKPIAKELFNILDNNFYMYVYMYPSKYNTYNRYIYIEYNENNSKIVKNVDKITLK